MECTKYTVVVALVLGNRLWMFKRKTITDKNFNGKWQFPNGKLKENECALTGAMREVNEKTDLVIDSKRFRYIAPIFNDSSSEICCAYCVELNSDEIPQRTYCLMSKWQLFTYKLAFKLDLIPGLPEILIDLKNFYEDELEKLPINVNA